MRQMGQWGELLKILQCPNEHRVARNATRFQIASKSTPYSGIWVAPKSIMPTRDLDRLEARTKAFTIAAIRLCIKLEVLPGLRRVTWQLIDAAGSVGSNHRAMRRARSDREFAAKLQIVNEEIDEAAFWLEVVEEVHPNACDELTPVLREAIELRSIFAKARSTFRQRP